MPLSTTIPFFESVSDGWTVEAYIESYFRAREPEWSDGRLKSAVEDSVFAHQQTLKTPFALAGKEDLKRLLPRDSWAKLTLHQREFGELMRRASFLPQGEDIVEDDVTCLLASWEELHRGTVVYRRKTSKALMLYARPYAVLNFETALFSGGPRLERRKPVLPAFVSVTAVNVALTSQAMPGEVFDAVNGACDVASSLVWALPQPWGAVASGAITLFKILFNLADDRPSPTQVAIQKAVGVLKDFIQQQNIADKEGDIVVFHEWFSSQIAVLKMIDNDPSYIENSVLKPLNRMLEPGAGTLPKALNALVQNFHAIDGKSADAYKQKEGLFNVLLVSVSVYFFALRMRIVLDAALASHFLEQENVENIEKWNGIWLGDYATLLVNVRGDAESKLPGWIATVEGLMAELKKARLGFIDLEHFPEEGHYINRPGIGKEPGSSDYIKDRNSGWGVVDRLTSERRFVRADDVERPSLSCKDHITAEHKEDAENFRQSWIDQLLAVELGKTSEAIRRWKHAGDEWYDHAPPKTPKGTVKVVSWESKTPQGSRWVQSNAVKYAVSFHNNRGASPLGPFTPWLEITDGAFPVLGNFPSDPLAMATRVYIYRRFRDSEHDELLANIPVAQTTFNDRRG